MSTSASLQSPGPLGHFQLGSNRDTSLERGDSQEISHHDLSNSGGSQNHQDRGLSAAPNPLTPADNPPTPAGRCEAIYHEIQRLSAQHTLAAQQQAVEPRLKTLYAELFEAGTERLPERRPNWVLSTQELHDVYPAFSFWKRVIPDSTLIPVRFDDWFFPQCFVELEEIQYLASWSGDDLEAETNDNPEAQTDQDIEAQKSYDLEAQAGGVLSQADMEQFAVGLRGDVKRATKRADRARTQGFVEAPQKRKRTPEDLDNDQHQRPSKKGKGNVGDRIQSPAGSSGLASTSQPAQEVYHIPKVPQQADDGEKFEGSNWFKREGRVLYTLVKAWREFERAAKRTVLKDIHLWDRMSSQLEARGVNRSGLACKNFWGRTGRSTFQYEERINPKNPNQLVTSAQPSKKEKEEEGKGGRTGKEGGGA